MATPQTGAFDLSDATSAIAFARFILSLRSHFVHIEECVNNTLTPIPWQSEDRPSDDSALPHNGEDLRILDWAAQVPRSCETGYVVNRFISKMGELICGTPPPPSLPPSPPFSLPHIHPPPFPPDHPHTL